MQNWKEKFESLRDLATVCKSDFASTENEFHLNAVECSRRYLDNFYRPRNIEFIL